MSARTSRRGNSSAPGVSERPTTQRQPQKGRARWSLRSYCESCSGAGARWRSARRRARRRGSQRVSPRRSDSSSRARCSTPAPRPRSSWTRRPRSSAISRSPSNRCRRAPPVYANFMASPTVLDLIGQRVGIPGDQIYAAGPIDPNVPRIVQEPTAVQRNVEITGETDSLPAELQQRPEPADDRHLRPGAHHQAGDRARQRGRREPRAVRLEHRDHQ